MIEGPFRVRRTLIPAGSGVWEWRTGIERRFSGEWRGDHWDYTNATWQSVGNLQRRHVQEYERAWDTGFAADRDKALRKIEKAERRLRSLIEAHEALAALRSAQRDTSISAP